MKYFPGRHRTTAANSGTMQYHATVEGPQNWALVWGPGSRAPESKVLEKFQYHATVEEYLRTEQQSWVPSANAGG